MQTETASPQTELQPVAAPSKTHRRPRGKVARLPAKVRDRLNGFLDEGLTYANVITQLGPEASHLNEMDISRWYTTGHQDWLKNQAWLEETRSRLDMAIDVISENTGTNVHLANLHVAATQLIENLLRAGERLLIDSPEDYVAVINSISRLGREALNYQKYNEACAQARAEIAKLKDPDRKFSQEETLAVVDKLDRILGFK